MATVHVSSIQPARFAQSSLNDTLYAISLFLFSAINRQARCWAHRLQVQDAAGAKDRLDKRNIRAPPHHMPHLGVIAASTPAASVD